MYTYISCFSGELKQTIFNYVYMCVCVCRGTFCMWADIPIGGLLHPHDLLRLRGWGRHDKCSYEPPCWLSMHCDDDPVCSIIFATHFSITTVWDDLFRLKFYFILYSLQWEPCFAFNIEYKNKCDSFIKAMHILFHRQP